MFSLSFQSCNAKLEHLHLLQPRKVSHMKTKENSKSRHSITKFSMMLTYYSLGLPWNRSDRHHKQLVRAPHYQEDQQELDINFYLVSWNEKSTESINNINLRSLCILSAATFSADTRNKPHAKAHNKYCITSEVT